MNLRERVTAWYRRTRARTYLAGYVVLVFGFGLIYTAMPGAFYHSTIRHEPAFKAATRDLRRLLQSTLSDTTRSAELDLPQGHAVIQGRMMFGDPSILDDRVAFTVTLPVYFTTHLRHAEMANFNVTMRADDWIVPKSLGRFVENRPVDVRQVDGPPISTDILAALWGCSTFSVETLGAVACLPDSVAQRIASFRRAWGGTPSGFPGTFGRMTYYSATLGFGDIVPLTGWARFLSGLEVFLSVVLAGAFVNRMTQRTGRAVE